MLAVGLLSVVSVVSGQTIERFVLGSFGGFTSASGYTLHSNLGEPIIDHAMPDSVYLFQGFIQPIINGSVETWETEKLNNQIDIYPSPANSMFFIRGESLRQATYEIQVTNTIGALIHRSTGSFEFLYRVNIDGWKSGIYFVKVLFNEGTNTACFKLIKN